MVALVDVPGFLVCTAPGVVVDTVVETEVVAVAVGLPAADRSG